MMLRAATPTALPRVHSGASLRSRAVLCRASLGEDAPDLFDELGVSPSDSAEELRTAYLRQIRLCHPDVAGAAGTERSVRLNAEYDVLSDASKRARYLASQSGAAFSRSRGSASGASAGPARREGVVGPLRQLRLLTRLLPRLGASGLVRGGCHSGATRHRHRLTVFFAGTRGGPRQREGLPQDAGLHH